jgi:hypothetical protein
VKRFFAMCFSCFWRLCGCSFEDVEAGGGAWRYSTTVMFTRYATVSDLSTKINA